MWDIGGQQAIRPYWKNYYENTDGLVYVVDSSDEVRLKECSETLQELLGEDNLQKVPLLVFANKQDLTFALDAEQVIIYLFLKYFLLNCFVLFKDNEHFDLTRYQG